ncbi:hypothetical protein GCM10007354_02770 [Acinetobacter courvalinii]|uniref:Uncharacterized protein n=1 Tax=Acinetobacter courvalinii TaxID=280147 RepID=A0ABD0A3I6_9GAMM|nr:hypothetical protein GCM10007354_02770 [Acinetobacter courvalinii]
MNNKNDLNVKIKAFNPIFKSTMAFSHTDYKVKTSLICTNLNYNLDVS